MKNKEFIWIFLLILFSAAVRLRFYQFAPQPIVEGDTYGYYLIGQRILNVQVPALFYLDQRPPVYPVFLNLVMILVGKFGAPLSSTDFFSGSRLTVVIQSLLGIAGVILLYKILREIEVKNIYAFLFSLFITTNWRLIYWEHVLVTESLVTFWLILLAFLLVKVIKKPKPIFFVWLLLSFIVGFLLKPVYVALPLVILLPLAWYFRQNKQATRLTLLTLFIYLILPIIQLRINVFYHNYRGLTHVADINILGKILKYNLPLESGKNLSYFYEAVSKYRKLGSQAQPYIFLNWLDGQILVGPDYPKLEELRRFSKSIMLANLPVYLLRSLPEMIEVLIAPGQPLNYLLLTFYPLYFFSIVQFIRQFITNLWQNSFLKIGAARRASVTVLFFVGTIVFYQLFMTVFFDYGEFERITSVVAPQLFLFIFSWSVLILQKPLDSLEAGLLRYFSWMKTKN